MQLYHDYFYNLYLHYFLSIMKLYQCYHLHMLYKNLKFFFLILFILQPFNNADIFVAVTSFTFALFSINNLTMSL